MTKLKRGGKRKGAGRPKGSKTAPPSTVIRVPLALVPAIEKLIEKWKQHS